jgi:hypothetical protein
MTQDRNTVQYSHMNLPMKLVRLIKMCEKETSAVRALAIQTFLPSLFSNISLRHQEYMRKSKRE